jgi:hypothetical protein
MEDISEFNYIINRFLIFNEIVIGLFIFVLIVILMETHNYYTGKYDKVKDDDDVKDDALPLHPIDLPNINVIRRKNTIIIN